MLLNINFISEPVLVGSVLNSVLNRFLESVLPVRFVPTRSGSWNRNRTDSRFHPYKAFEHCMEDIILKLSNVETMTDANEATRCEFISAILHASIAIAKKLTSQDIFIVLQKDVSDEDAKSITEGKPRNIKIGYAQVRLLHRSVFFRRFNINILFFLESSAT
jgi:hypothetical protein